MKIFSEIEALISADRLAEVFASYEIVGYERSTFILLKGRFTANEKSRRSGALNYSDYSVAKSQILQSILNTQNSQWVKVSGATVADPGTVPYASTTKRSSSDVELRSVGDARNLYADLRQKLNDYELKDVEVKKAAFALWATTKEQVFEDVADGIDKASVNRRDMRKAMVEAVETLEKYKEEVFSFLREQNKEVQKKSLEKLLSDFAVAPRTDTFEAFSKEVTEVFKSNAFYTKEIRAKLKVLLDERPSLEVFGFGARIGTWVGRVQVWLNENYKG